MYDFKGKSFLLTKCNCDIFYLRLNLCEDRYYEDFEVIVNYNKSMSLNVRLSRLEKSLQNMPDIKKKVVLSRR